MNQQDTLITNKKESFQWAFLLVGLALVAGLVLSILSWLELCVEHCSANQDYRLFGLPFAIIGIAFFATLICLHLLSQKYLFLNAWVSGFIASSLGAEMLFITVQKYQIGHWCPVCLSIAATVAFAIMTLSVSSLAQIKKINPLFSRGSFMKIMRHSFSSFVFIIAGFLAAFVGVSNPSSAEAVAAEMKERLAFGLKGSQIEVYFATDWYCPSCKKVEPIIEKLYPKIREKATFFFIDYPVHKKSMNYSPYNLAFLINNKKQYFKARQLLSDLTDKTESPKDEDIQKAAKKKGIAFQGLSFVDIKSGMDFFDEIVDKYQMSSTPTLIFTNLKNQHVIKLEGRDEITEDKVMDALEKIQQSPPKD